MRVLRVLGIAENGGHLVCVDAEPGDEPSDSFALPIDDRLRAAVRGDLSRFGQLEIEMEPQLRPREIQSRIRAGASVEQVAAAAGCTPQRIERYAYPVLMERNTISERARRVHPLQGAAMGSVGAANAGRTLEEIVAATLADRGQQQELAWDAFRDERGWTVTVTWRAGRSENRAEWAYHAGPDGGSVTARNQEAGDLIEPAPRPLRTIGDGHHGGTVAAAGGAASATVPGAGGTRPNRVARASRPDPAHEQLLVEDTVTDQRSGALPPATGGSTSAGDTAATGERTGTEDLSAAGPTAAQAVGGSASDAGQSDRPAGRAARRGHRPPMPSWEDVLLGTRASGR